MGPSEYLEAHKGTIGDLIVWAENVLQLMYLGYAIFTWV